MTFTGGASGTNSTGGLLTTPSVTSSPVQIQAAPTLVITTFRAGPASVNVGGTINVNMTVSNTGSAIATAVTPSALTLSNPTLATLAAGPGPQAIAGGATATFFWTFTAANPGVLDFTGSVSGADALSGIPISSPPAISNAVGIGVPAPTSPVLFITPASLTFSQAGSGVPPSQSISVTNSGGGRLSWTAAATTTIGVPWLSLAPASGTAPSTMTVSAESFGVPGTYSGTITVTAPGADGSSQVVPVTLTVTLEPPGVITALIASPPAAEVGQPVAFTVTGSGNCYVALALGDGTAGSVTGNLPLFMSHTYTAVGTFTATATATGPVNCSGSASASVSVTATPPPTIGKSPPSLSFTAVQEGNNPASQTLNITNAGGGTLIWSVSGDAPWLSLSPTSGSATTGTNPITVSVNTAGLAPNTYSAIITITAPGTTNTPQTVPVTLTIVPPSAFAVTVTLQGSGTGTVTSSPGGISCGSGSQNTGTCTASFPSGTGVTLTAAPTGGSTFGGWGGDCAGQGSPCTFTMSAPKAVAATFTPPPAIVSPTAVVALNGATFRTGQTIAYQATLTPGSVPVQVDIYLGALLPDGVTFLSLVPVSGGFISIALGPSPIPFRTDVALTPTVVPFSYAFQGLEPVGTYFTYASLVVAGGHPLQLSNQLSVAVQAFQFSP